MNTVVLIGRLTKDVEMRFIAESGTPVASFTIAVDRNYKTKSGEKVTDFIPVQYMGKIAENLAKYIGKGSLVCVEGNIRIDNYKNEAGENRSFTKVQGKNIQFLDSKKDKKEDTGFKPNFDTSDFNQGEFQSIDDDEIPF